MLHSPVCPLSPHLIVDSRSFRGLFHQAGVQRPRWRPFPRFDLRLNPRLVEPTTQCLGFPTWIYLQIGPPQLNLHLQVHAHNRSWPSPGLGQTHAPIWEKEVDGFVALDRSARLCSATKSWRPVLFPVATSGILGIFAL